MNIFDHFQNITLTNDQRNALERLSIFLESDEKVFILQGYAGTGKTTILKGVSQYLRSTQKQFQIMAPTGRAAKVLRDKTGGGKTIHSSIYDYENMKSINKDAADVAEHSFQYLFPIKNDETTAKVIIVDESSMISNKESKRELFAFGTDILLKDILTYAKLKTTSNKIIFVGDSAQLPPVTDNHSYALDRTYFESLGIKTDEVEMKQVVRQGNNLILENATTIRELLKQDKRIELKLQYDEDSYIKTEVQDIIEKYTELNLIPEVGNGSIICFSNAQAFHYNKAIRARIFSGENTIVPGDLVLINNNNYHTFGEELFNGDIAKVVDINPITTNQSAPIWCEEGGKRVRKTITLTFRYITIRLPHISHDIHCSIIESLLNSIDRDLSVEEMKALYINFVMRFNDEQKKRKEKGLDVFKVGSQVFKEALKHDKYFNALRVKFGYAITCHKSQGGEWDKVFVDYYGRTSLKDNPLRWCYTATTRGINTVFAINAPHFTRMDHFRFSSIGKITKLPKDALYLENINLSPFHSREQHKCKSWKYWEIKEKLEGSPYQTISVESKGDYLERYTVKKDDIEIVLQANHKGSGHFIEKFYVVNPIDEDTKKEIENIFNAEHIPDFEPVYTPSTEILDGLYSHMRAACNEIGIAITNIIEKTENYLVTYYLITSAPCAYIQFYINGEGNLGTAISKTFDCDDDKKLKQLIQKLLTDVC